MRPLANVNPLSLADAVERLERGGGRAAAVGGGSDLLGMIKDDSGLARRALESQDRSPPRTT